MLLVSLAGFERLSIGAEKHTNFKVEFNFTG
jgi:hypothetical protein